MSKNWSSSDSASGSAAWGSAPWARRGRFFEAGEVRIAILALLSERGKHGYELMKELEARSGGIYKISAGTLYPTLAQLEEEGMVVSEHRDGRRVNRITDLGKNELEREHATVDQIWRRASHWGDWGQWMGPGVAVISGSLGALLKAAFRSMKQNGEDLKHKRRVEDILDRARRELEEL
jgi:DNA-binding PadR family transcriptional regulator